MYDIFEFDCTYLVRPVLESGVFAIYAHSFFKHENLLLYKIARDLVNVWDSDCTPTRQEGEKGPVIVFFYIKEILRISSLGIPLISFD